MPIEIDSTALDPGLARIRLPMTFSATRIDTWMNCNRKAAWEYICGYKSPQEAGQARGDQVHKYLEWLKRNEGALPDRTDEIGAIAAEALPYVEHLSLATGAIIEGEFTFDGDRHRWTGRGDIKQPGREVWDYKTSSDPTRWAKTPEDLLLDAQAMLYAEREFRLFPNLEWLDMTWLYLASRKPYRAKPVPFTVPRHHAAACFRALESYADEMQAAAYAAPADIVARHKYVLEVIQPNYGYCNAYRKPCPHTARCNLPLFQEHPTETKSMNLLDRLKAMDALNGGAANAAPEPAPAPAAAAPPATAGNPMLPRREPNMDPGAPVQAASAPAPAAINPPAKRPVGRPRKTDTVPAPPPAYVGAAAAVLPPPEAAPAAPPAALSSVGASAPTGALTVTPAAAPPPAPAVARPLPAPCAGHRIAQLFVGCMPMIMDGDIPIMSFDAIVARAKEMITLPVYFAGFGYKSNGLLLEAVQRIIEADKPESVLVFDPRTPEAMLCLSHLRSIATMSVESVRQ